MSFGGRSGLNGMTLPPDVAIMLDTSTRRFFDELPDRQKRRYVEPIVQARRPENRDYRIASTIRMLRERSAGC